MPTLFADIRFALRLATRNPGFSLVTVLILALGIGLNSVIFSLVYAVLLAPLPFDEPDQLVFIQERSRKFRAMSVSYPNFLDYRERQQVFSEIAAHRNQAFNFTGGDGPPEQLSGVHASASLFPLLRVEADLGRVYVEDEDQFGAPRLAVLGHGFWKRRLGGDPEILGKAIPLDGEPYEVIGVLPEGFVYPLFQDRVDVYTSIGRWVGERVDSRMERGNHPGITLAARLRPGVTTDQAQESLDAISRSLEAEYPDTNTGLSTLLTPLQERVTRNLRPALLVLASSVLLLLLLTCVNVANLHLARSTSRSAEIAVRSALGAGRKRVFRQMLTESVVQGLLAGLIGLGLAYATQRLLPAFLDPSAIPSFVRIELGQPVLFFTLFASLAAGVFFGLAPALQMLRPELAQTLRDNVRGSGGIGRHRLRSGLVVAEVALAMLLLAESVLFIQSFRYLTETDPGFEAENLLLFEIALPVKQYGEPNQQALFFGQLKQRLESLPGATLVSHSMPLLGGWQSTVTGEGLPLPSVGETPSTEIQRVGPDYFETVGLRLIRGRYLEERDRAGGRRVSVVDERFAELLWPGEDPVGRRWRFGRPDQDDPDEDPDEDPYIEVVGVVNHVKTYGVENDSRIQAYIPSAQDSLPFTSFLVKTAGDPYSLAPLLQTEVSELDPDIPLANVRTMQQHLSQRVVPQRMAAGLLTLFAALAVMLAVLGIYGVMAYSVSQREKEVGIRVALGAANRHVLQMIVGHGMALTLLGLLIGGGLVLLLTPLVDSQLFGVDVHNPFLFLVTATSILAVGLAASLIPALRAIRLNVAATLQG